MVSQRANAPSPSNTDRPKELAYGSMDGKSHCCGYSCKWIAGSFGAQSGLDRGVGGYAWSALVIAIVPVAVAVAAVFGKRKMREAKADVVMSEVIA